MYIWLDELISGNLKMRPDSINENKTKTSTYLNISIRVSPGHVLRPDNSEWRRLTLCVAVETGVIGASRSFKKCRPVSGVIGARLRVYKE